MNAMDTPTVEELIYRAMEDEKKRGAAGLSFAPVYSFVSAVAHMARGQERQAIIDALPKDGSERKSEEWNDGYNAAITAVIRVLVERSCTH
jgi:hypothetical protein